ncbi:sulfatase-like hydrolase/transferase [Ovoidimarina sediminis]|uniref:sulfatase-like hydrolase/transferase n=1 Tax=Ovoidimarina sediminis TaxID=3079856 RepID=UPI002908B426|nr:sulfatase-like hydrolase/transferase [Rhodophyticola sp. MJ-SS7]MDU8941876.1 sulfatase-like hydrolase/transferase [Rhodophyticola sp. MJ-SS7]
MTLRQPNILLIMADQMTPFMLEACGGTGARTEHMSALAARAATFTNAYTPSPICVPARSCFMTGLHTSTTGCYDNGDPFPGYLPTFAHYLANAGYETVLSGKMHFIGADQLHGFQRRLNTDIYPSGHLWSYPLPPEDDPDAKAFDFTPQYLAENIGPGWSKELQYDEETHFRAMEYLRHAPKRPWMLTVSFTNPHPPYKVPRRYWEIYEDADMPLPIYPDDMDDRYSAYDHAIRRWHGLHLRGDEIRDPENLRAMRRGFAALAHYVDDKIGELLGVLEEAGTRDDTLVIVTSDHGEMLGERGMIQKRSLHEWSARIPLFIDMPGAVPRRIDTPVSLIDLPATLIDIAQETSVRPLEGRSLLPAIHGAELAVIPVISEYHGEGIMRPSFMVRLGDWKYHYCHGTPPQLYNLAEDPGEWANRAGDPDCAEIESTLNQVITGGAFDLDRIASEVWDRLPMKAVVNAAMKANGTAWDYIPDPDATAGYLRE